MDKKMGQTEAHPSKKLPLNSTTDRRATTAETARYPGGLGGDAMGLKLYRVDVPAAQVASYTTLAETEAEALALIAAACEGNQDARNRVTFTASLPEYGAGQKRVRWAEPGTPEEKRLLAERLYPARAVIFMEAMPDEN